MASLEFTTVILLGAGEFQICPIWKGSGNKFVINISKSLMKTLTLGTY